METSRAAPPTEAQLDHRHTPRPFRPFKRQVNRCQPCIGGSSVLHDMLDPFIMSTIPAVESLPVHTEVLCSLEVDSSLCCIPHVVRTSS